MFENKIIISVDDDGAIDSVTYADGSKLSTQSMKSVASKLNQYVPNMCHYVYIGKTRAHDHLYRIGISKNPYKIAERLDLELIRLIRFQTRTAAKALEFKILRTVFDAGYRSDDLYVLEHLPNTTEWINSRGDPRVPKYLKHVPIPNSPLFAGAEEEILQTKH